MDAPEAVRSYKSLAEVERAFRSMKTIDLHIRPIHHHLERRVRAHIFLCMLGFCVEWHTREVWLELLFADEELERKKHCDPVAPAVRSEARLEKVTTRTLKDGSPVHSFRTLSQELSTIVRNTCGPPAARRPAATFQMMTFADPYQQRARSTAGDHSVATLTARKNISTP